MYQCHECGELHEISAHSSMNNRKIRFCPKCGASGLQQVKSSFGVFNARCFLGAPNDLVYLQYSVWRANKFDEQAHWPLFAKYFQHQIKEYMKKQSPKPIGDGC